MEIRDKCETCGQFFWTKAKKNKDTGIVEPRNDRCQSCRNRIAHQKNMIRKDISRVVAIPKDMERQIRIRELIQAEMKRRREVPTIKELGQEEVLAKSKEQREKLIKKMNEEKNREEEKNVD